MFGTSVRSDSQISAAIRLLGMQCHARQNIDGENRLLQQCRLCQAALAPIPAGSVTKIQNEGLKQDDNTGVELSQVVNV